MKQKVNQKNNQSEMTPDYLRRFGAIAQLYGDEGLALIAKSQVCVIGLGGVGSWVAESLARSGIGSINLIDMDVVAISNINRQLLATTNNVGRDKVLVMAERIGLINPDCVVTVVDDFIQADNFTQYLKQDFDYIIDCIDDYRTKAALIQYCKTNKLSLLTTGAAGGLVDPSKVRQADLSRTQHDKLLATTRKQLRQKYGFTRNAGTSFKVPCIYSDEQAVYPDGKGGVSGRKSFDNDRKEASSALSCSSGIGSITHVTASFAMHATAFILGRVSHAK